jgi:hypothetical protein
MWQFIKNLVKPPTRKPIVGEIWYLPHIKGTNPFKCKESYHVEILAIKEDWVQYGIVGALLKFELPIKTFIYVYKPNET